MGNLSIVLKQLRESKGMTLEELAKKSGVGRGTIGDIETGKNKSTVKTLSKLSTALGLNREEKDKLDSAFLGRKIVDIEAIAPEPMALDLDIDEISQYEKVINEAKIFFNDKDVSIEDKQKMVLDINELFFKSKNNK